MFKFITIFLIMFLMSLTACQESQVTEPLNPQTSNAVYVCNAGASSLSVIDLETGKVTNDLTTIGTWPNQLVYENKRVYCVNSGSNNISIFNTISGENEQPIELGSGQNPMNMVIFDNNWIYVTCLLTNRVLQVDRASKSVVKAVGCGIGTTGIVAANGKIYASNSNAVFNNTAVVYGPGSVTVIDGVSADSLSTIAVATNPQVVGRSSNGNVHVLCTGNYADDWGKIFVINPQSDEIIDTIEIGGSPGGMDVASISGVGYLSYWGLGLLSYNTHDNALINNAPAYLLGKGGSGLVSDENGNVYISVWEENQVIKISRSGEVLDGWSVGLNPQALALSQD